MAGGRDLNVTATGTKSWVCRWKKQGRVSEMGLGGYPALTLKAARDAAQDCREMIAQGQNPITERQKERDTGHTFLKAAEAYLSVNTWEKKTTEQHETDFRTKCKPLHHRLLQDIGPDDLARLLRPRWLSHVETSKRLHRRIRAVFKYAKQMGWLEGENPADLEGRLGGLLAKRGHHEAKHHKAMPVAEVPAFMEKLRTLHTNGAKGLEFTILTAARTKQTMEARWEEIDWKAGLWVIPAERMKQKRDHRVPLSRQALAVLEAMKPHCTEGFIFAGQKKDSPLSNMAFASVMKRLGAGSYTVHGFRSTFRDWAAEATDFPYDVAELALSHAVGNSVERAYLRGDMLERRRLLTQAFADRCDGHTVQGLVLESALQDPKVVSFTHRKRQDEAVASSQVDASTV